MALKPLSVAVFTSILVTGCGQVTVHNRNVGQPDREITTQDAGRTIDFDEGDQIWVRLRPPAGYQPYSIPNSTDLSVIALLYVGSGADPMFGAFGPGAARLTSRALPVCPGAACDKPARDWTVDVHIAPASFHRNTWLIRVPAGEAMDTVRLRLRARDSVQVVLTPDWTQPVSSDPSIMAPIPGAVAPRGHWWTPTPFGAQKSGHAEITSRFDPDCFHSVPRCEMPERTFSAQISVL